MKSSMTSQWRAVVLAALLLAGCAPNSSQEPLTEQHCTSGVAVVWSSLYAHTSYFEFWDQAGKQASVPAKVQGISVIDSTAGTSSVVSNGNLQHNTSAITTVDRSRCTAAVHTLKQTGVLSSAPTRDGLVTLYNSAGDGNSSLDWYRSDGTRTASRKFEQLAAALADDGKRILTFPLPFSDDLTNKPPLVLEVRDSATFELKRSVNLSAALQLPTADNPAPSSAVIVGDSAYISLSYYTVYSGSSSHDVLPQALIKVNLTTGAAQWVSLQHQLPYQLLVHKGQVYVAHTFLNPGIKPFSEYRYISRLNPVSDKVETFDVGPNLNQIAFSGDRLYVLHYDGQSEPSLDVRNPDTLELLARHTLPGPKGNEHYYIAGIGLGTRP